MIHDRSFGVEIECFSRSGAVRHAEVAAAIEAAGVACGHSTSNRTRAAGSWVVKYDGSVTGGVPIEIVSPPLRGEEGFAQIRAVCGALAGLDLGVNRSCGLHVHVDIRTPEFPLEAARKLVATYAANEPVIDTLMPLSRRAHNNRYARSVANVSTASIASARSLHDLARLIPGGRYTKLNFHAMWVHGTIEFRQHAGTLDAEKIINWATLCLRMVDKSSADPALPATRRRRRPMRGRKATYIAMVTSPQGCTRDEVHAATGWRGNIGLHAMAREAGLDLRSARVPDRGLVWYGTAAAVVSDTARPTLEVLATTLEMTQPERDFWAERARHFGVAGNATSGVA